MTITLQEHIEIGPHTTFQIGGPARFFCVVRTVDELIEALTYAKEKALPVFVLGGGSNILVGDAGFAGLVIKIEIKGIRFRDDSPLYTLSAGAGEVWDDVVAMACARSLRGIENLSGIPGTVGAAPVQNIGAYGVEIATVVESIDALHAETLEKRTFTREECTFAYRESFFKTAEGRKYIITHVHLELMSNKPANLSYKDLKEYYAQHPEWPTSAQGVRDAVLSIRKTKLPDWHVMGTAGSFFKNPIIPTEHFLRLKKEFPDLPSYPVVVAGPAAAYGSASVSASASASSGTLHGEALEGVVKVSLAWIIDKVCGYKGVSHGSVGTYQNQALVLVNNGGATAQEVKDFAQEIIDVVYAKTAIRVEPEVEYIGW